MTAKIVIAGVGMIPFKPAGASAVYTEMGAQAARLALADACAGYESIQQAFVSYVHGDSTAGQRVLYELGLTGIPIVNVRNGCASGATALYLARQAIASGEAEITLALGFEQQPEAAADPLSLTSGAAAAVLCSEAYARLHGLDTRVWIAGVGMAGDAVAKACAMAGIGPEDVDVPEVGTLHRQGEPNGATDLAQCHELVLQLRGQAGGTRIALQLSLDPGAAAVVMIYRI